MTKQNFLAALLAFACVPLARAETVPAAQAKEQGFNTCRDMVELLSKHLVASNEHAAVSSWNTKDTDGRMFNSQVVTRYSDGHSFATISVAPTADGKCDGTYTSAFYSAKSCTVVRETAFKEWDFFSESAGLVVLINKDKTVNKVLLPAGQGCVALNTEIVYG